MPEYPRNPPLFISKPDAPPPAQSPTPIPAPSALPLPDDEDDGLPSVQGRRLTCSHNDFERSCRVMIMEHQLDPDPSALIGVLANAVRLSREYVDYVRSRMPSSSPGQDAPIVPFMLDDLHKTIKELKRDRDLWRDRAIGAEATVRKRGEDIARIEKIITDAANLVDPDCPDAGAYMDGHCDLNSAISGAIERAATIGGAEAAEMNQPTTEHIRAVVAECITQVSQQHGWPYATNTPPIMGGPLLCPHGNPSPMHGPYMLPCQCEAKADQAARDADALLEHGRAFGAISLAVAAIDGGSAITPWQDVVVRIKAIGEKLSATQVPVGAVSDGMLKAALDAVMKEWPYKDSAYLNSGQNAAQRDEVWSFRKKFLTVALNAAAAWTRPMVSAPELTEEDWVQVEMAVQCGGSGSITEWPRLRTALRKLVVLKPKPTIEPGAPS